MRRLLARFKGTLLGIFAKRANLHLLTPTPYIEVTMQISPDGTRRLYASKAETSEQAQAVVQHLMQAAFEVAKHYGITIQMTPPGAKP